MSCVGLFLLSMVMSCQELRYMMWGQTTEARIVRDEVDKGRSLSRSTYTRRLVIYAFMDGDLRRQEQAEIPMDWVRPGDTITVQYIAGRDYQSRLADTHHWGWITIFATSVAAIAISLVWIGRSDK